MNKLSLLTTLLLSAFIMMPLEMSAAASSAQQADHVTGKVTDESGEPVIGAGVTVQGTTKGTITDIDGFYSIDATAGQVLTFSSIGYVDQSVTTYTLSFTVTIMHLSRDCACTGHVNIIH